MNSRRVFPPQTKVAKEVSLSVLFVAGFIAAAALSFAAGFIGVVSDVPCGMVAARAEEKKRARPRNGRWGSICMAKE